MKTIYTVTTILLLAYSSAHAGLELGANSAQTGAEKRLEAADTAEVVCGSGYETNGLYYSTMAISKLNEKLKTMKVKSVSAVVLVNGAEQACVSVTK